MSINVQVSPSPSVNISVGAGGNLLNLTPLGYTLHANTHISGGIDAINHNFLLGLQGGENNQYYHLNSGQYVNLNNIISSTGTYTLHSETGAFYASSNPSGFITGINNIVYDFGNQNISGIKNFYLRPTVNGTGILLSGDITTQAEATGVSGYLQGQITVLNDQTGSYTLHSETGAFYAASNPSGFITGINNLVFTTGNQIISGAKTFSNNLVVGGNDLFVDTSTDRVGISTASPITTLDVNGSGLFRSGLNVSLITSTGSDFYLSGKNNAIEVYPGSNIGGFVNLRGGSGTLVGGYIDLKGGDNAGIIKIQGGNGILENANLPVGQVLLSSFSTEFNRFNNYSSNVVFWKTGLSTMVENARVSQDSISINNNLLITGNRPTVNGTGILLSGEATTQSYVTGISGNLQTQINTLYNQTGDYALKSNTGSFLTTSVADNKYVSLNGDQTIYNTKTFSNDVYINRLFVTGSETIASTTVSNIQSPYIILNLTGGATDGGMFFITGAGLTGINDSGPIIGFDHSDKFKFGVSTRASDLSTLATIGSVEQITGLSGYLQPQITTLNNQTGSYALSANTGEFLTTSSNSFGVANSNGDINLNKFGAAENGKIIYLNQFGTQESSSLIIENNFGERATTNNIGNDSTNIYIGNNSPNIRIGEEGGFVSIGYHCSANYFGASAIYNYFGVEDGAGGSINEFGSSANINYFGQDSTNIYYSGSGVGQFNFDTNLKVGNASTVLTTGNQIISGAKTFVTGVSISGNVGIGTATPAQKLDVVGAIQTSSNLFVGGSIIYMNQQQALFQGANSLTLGNAAYWTSLRYGHTSTTTHSFLAGNVGIGTTTPSYKLDVNGNANISGNLTISGQYNIYQEIEKAKILAIAYAIAL